MRDCSHTISLYKLNKPAAEIFGLSYIVLTFDIHFGTGVAYLLSLCVGAKNIKHNW